MGGTMFMAGRSEIAMVKILQYKHIISCSYTSSCRIRSLESVDCRFLLAHIRLPKHEYGNTTY